jgi:hypothetical protein
VALGLTAAFLYFWWPVCERMAQALLQMPLEEADIKRNWVNATDIPMYLDICSGLVVNFSVLAIYQWLHKEKVIPFLLLLLVALANAVLIAWPREEHINMDVETAVPLMLIACMVFPMTLCGAWFMNRKSKLEKALAAYQINRLKTEAKPVVHISPPIMNTQTAKQEVKPNDPPKEKEKPPVVPLPEEKHITNTPPAKETAKPLDNNKDDDDEQEYNDPDWGL